MLGRTFACRVCQLQLNVKFVLSNPDRVRLMKVNLHPIPTIQRENLYRKVMLMLPHVKNHRKEYVNLIKSTVKNMMIYELKIFQTMAKTLSTICSVISEPNITTMYLSQTRIDAETIQEMYRCIRMNDLVYFKLY